MKITKAAQLISYRRKKDRSVSLTFETQELPSADLSQIDNMSLNADIGILYFRADEKANKEEMEALDSLDIDLYDQPKSLSQRLRNVLAVLAKQQGLDVKDFYKSEMNKIIEHYKNKIE